MSHERLSLNNEGVTGSRENYKAINQESNLTPEVNVASIRSFDHEENAREENRYHNWKDAHKRKGFRSQRIGMWLWDDGNFFLSATGAGLGFMAVVLSNPLGAPAIVLAAATVAGYTAARYVLAPALSRFFMNRGKKHHKIWTLSGAQKDFNKPKWD